MIQKKTKHLKAAGRALTAKARREKKRPTRQRRARRRVLVGLPVAAGLVALVIVIVRSLRPVIIPNPATQPAVVRTAPTGRSGR
ncbi:MULTISPECIES: hypothetical protein [Micrococcaceae]|uniref:hypothetical protein n=1 Tax=Micrococcaceae TaxID=1268 RepID=UPI0022DDA090|nr:MULTISPECIES: hypothetical protein [Micrococcaceae]WBL18948.1 hypothetical protein O1A05_14550 [Citricoccus sp. NR2]